MRVPVWHDGGYKFAPKTKGQLDDPLNAIQGLRENNMGSGPSQTPQTQEDEVTGDSAVAEQIELEYVERLIIYYEMFIGFGHDEDISRTKN